jgi:hypothetical protein
LLPYKKTPHNRFPYLSLYQLNIIFYSYFIVFFSFILLFFFTHFYFDSRKLSQLVVYRLHLLTAQSSQLNPRQIVSTVAHYSCNNISSFFLALFRCRWQEIWASTTTFAPLSESGYQIFNLIFFFYEYIFFMCFIMFGPLLLEDFLLLFFNRFVGRDKEVG